jgi:mono/diheme cytochrome c family protein
MRSIIGVFMALMCAKAFAAPKESPELEAKGKAVYASTCALCHGEAGDLEKSPTGKAMNARNLTKDPFKAGDTAEKIFETVSKGLPATAMAAFGHLPEDDRWAVSYYVKSLRAAGSAKAAAPVPADAPKK